MTLFYQNEYPWQVALKATGSSYPFCGGSIITNMMVLTAAHCEMGINDFMVVVGDHTVFSNDRQAS